MNLVGQLTHRFLPQSFGNRLHYIKDRLELGAIPPLEYDTSRLRSRESVNLDAIFRSTECDAAWKAVRDDLAAFGIPDGTGGVNPGDRRAVFYLVNALKPRAVLEVGTHIGASTVHIAAALHEGRVRRGEQASLTTVDVADVNSGTVKPWLKNGMDMSPAVMIDELGYSEFVTFVTNNSLRYAAECGRRFDFIFLDGDHAARTVYRETSAALKLLNPGGVILLHDYFPRMKPLWSNGAVVTGPCMATDRLQEEGVDAAVLPLGRLPWPTKLDSSFTSLALLLKK